MKLLTSKTLFLLFVILILKSVTVWSSNLDKIKMIKEEISLKSANFSDFEGNFVSILDKDIEFYLLNFGHLGVLLALKKRALNELKNLSNVKIITVSQDVDIEDAKAFLRKIPMKI